MATIATIATKRIVFTCATPEFGESAACLFGSLPCDIEKYMYTFGGWTPEQLNLFAVTHPDVQLLEFGAETRDGHFFVDYMRPHFFAWKLWSLHDMIKRQHDTALVLYIDSGAMVANQEAFAGVFEIMDREGIYLVEDHEHTNRRWCHGDFRQAMSTTEEELDAQQLLAGLIGVRTNSRYVDDVFVPAFELSKARAVIAGERYFAYSSDCTGHRHDQSILSILTQRVNAPRQFAQDHYGHTSYEDCVFRGITFYLHRRKYVRICPVAPGIGQGVIFTNTDDDETSQDAQYAGLYMVVTDDPGGSEIHQHFWNKLATSDPTVCPAIVIVDRTLGGLGPDWMRQWACTHERPGAVIADVVLFEPQTTAQSPAAYVITIEGAAKLLRLSLAHPIGDTKVMEWMRQMWNADEIVVGVTGL